MKINKMTINKMTQARWDTLMQQDDIYLTVEEMNNGWHWCACWDGLLVHVNAVEFKSCTCQIMNKFRSKDQAK